MIVKDKEDLRKKLLAKLLALTCEERKRRSQMVEKNISDFSLYQQAKVIMVYYPLKGEVDLLGIVRKALGKKKICFPVIDLPNNNLIPYLAGNLTKGFSRGPYGVIQPEVNQTQSMPTEDIDLVLIPGLAFDIRKNRLGRGGGFYDRFIKKLSVHTKTIGVAFNFQILKDLPVSIPQDECVDFLITDSQIL